MAGRWAAADLAAGGRATSGADTAQDDEHVPYGPRDDR
jgi:hypothetical protein